MKTNRKPRLKALTVEQKIKRRNFLSFTTFFVAGAIGYSGWKWLYNSPKEIPGVTGGAKVPLRRALNKTELIFRKFFSNDHHVKLYPKSMAAKTVRVNSDIGLTDKTFDPSLWQLNVVKSPVETLKISIDEIRRLPKTEIVFSFKCVEGWDQIQHWAGVKFCDFIAHYGLDSLAKKDYIGMSTPDGKYYVGLDSESALHPQTLLAYEMNDQPVRPEHGAPLRLIIPVKYGIKNLKRIGTITFSNRRPPDYWAQLGYDYYSGL